MDRDGFLAWLAEADGLSAPQRGEAARVLAEPVSLTSVLRLLEDRIGTDRCCPRCAVTGAVVRGRANGLRRYHCRGCGRTFNALTGTPLARLRLKGLWAAFAASLSEDQTVKTSAARCGVADTTAFRWRHRFLRAVKAGTVKLRGIVEADETYVLASRKGERKLDRKARRRGGKARKRGLSKEQVPILVAADRAGTTLTGLLPEVTAEALRAHLAPVLDKDILLVSDGATLYPRCARALGVTHQALNRSVGERARGELHLQTVNSRHERLKSFLRRHRGVATRYLDSYLAWYHLAVLPRAPTPRSVLASVAGLVPVREPVCIANAN